MESVYEKNEYLITVITYTFAFPEIGKLQQVFSRYFIYIIC